MKKKIILEVMLTGFAVYVHAQSGFNPLTAAHSIEVFDPNGRRFVNPAPDVEGSPFFKDEWIDGTVISNDNKKYDDIKLRLNLQTQELHFLAKDNTEMAVPKGIVKGVLLYDSAGTNDKTASEFQSGFPPVDNNSTNNFYQVLSKGKITLLKSLKKSISVRKDELSGEIKKEFVLYEDYYLFSQNTLQRVKRNKSFILTLLADKKDKIEKFANDNKLSYKSFDEIKQIISYYNSLP